VSLQCTEHDSIHVEVIRLRDQHCEMGREIALISGRMEDRLRRTSVFVNKHMRLLFGVGDDEEEEEENTSCTMSNMEALFQTYMAKQSQKFLMGYIVIQLVYLVCFFIAATLHKLNYVPLVADCIMLFLHIIVVFLHVYHRRNRKTIENFSFPRIMLDATLMIDALFFALSDPVVESQANRILHVAKLFDALGGIPSLDGPVLHHPYKSNSVFQFHVMYMSLFVLSFTSAVIMTPVCMVIYGFIVLSCYRNYYNKSEQVQQVVWEDVFTDIVVTILTLCCTVFAKRMLERLQRSFFEALQNEKKKALEEKVMRCKVEFENANLHDMLTSSLAADRLRMRAGRSSKFPRKFRRMMKLKPPSVKSAPPVITSRPAAGNSAEVDEVVPPSLSQDCQGNGDCLPAEALVWVDHHMDPQPLHTLKAGQRVLCYDNLLQCVKHVQVVEATVMEEDSPKEYVTVQLADGTFLEMTSDHHVECYRDEAQEQRKCIPAMNLQEGRDSIMVLNIQPQEVTKVVLSSRGEDDAHRRWVSLNVQQPQRHLVFVANHRKTRGRYPQTMAVGSADLKPTFAHVKHTFVDVPDSEQSSGRKTNSAPPTYSQHVDVSSPAMSLQISGTASLDYGPAPISALLAAMPDLIRPDMSHVSSDLETGGRNDFESQSEILDDITSDALSSQGSVLPGARVQTSSSWRRRQRQRERRRQGHLNNLGGEVAPSSSSRGQHADEFEVV